MTRVDDLQKGKDELQKILRKQGLSMSSSAGGKALDAVAKEMNYLADRRPARRDRCGQDLAEAGRHQAHQAAAEARPKLPAGAGARGRNVPLPPTTPMTPPREKRRKSQTGVAVKGIDDVLVRLARCCNPVPGDEIIGFVTRGRGVSVHRADCPNARELLGQAERIIDVEWDSGHATTYQVEIVIEALDRTHLLHEISSVLAEAGVNILSANVSTDRHGIAHDAVPVRAGEHGTPAGAAHRGARDRGRVRRERMMPAPANGKKKGAKR